MERIVTERTAGVLERTLRMRDRAKRSRCGAWRCRNRRAWCIRQAPGYYAQYTALGNLMSLQSDGQMMLLAGMGLHGYEPRVNTLFGFPRGIRPGGVIFDIPIAGVQLTDGLEKEKTAQFNQQIGLLSSALEHATPEQMFSTETEPADAISAVKALSKANAQGQRIYQMTRDNMAETLPNLNLARETENEIRTALLAGLTVIEHTDNVSVPGWTGSGYIIFNPETGSGAYKISGGANGGFWGVLSFIIVFVTFITMVIVPFVILAASGPVAGLIAALLTGIGIRDLIKGIEAIADNNANESAEARAKQIIAFAILKLTLAVVSIFAAGANPADPADELIIVSKWIAVFTNSLLGQLIKEL